MLKQGSVIDGKYKIIKEIGKGGMSTVYLSLNERLNQKWAVKEINRDCCENYEIVRQGLLTEMNILKRLDHPNLPRIVDVIQYGSSMLIIMDYIEGKTLKNILKIYGPIEEKIILDWSRQIVDVLFYLHTRIPPIIYRDLKPSNLMLKSDGRIILIDFGTAREYRKDGFDEDTMCLGTRGYAAPEQYGGNGQTDERTDIYCFGVTIYHLLTGKSPEKPPYKIYPIRYFNSDFSQGLESLIIKCTEINPEERYQNCLELMYALGHVEENSREYYRKEKKKLCFFLILLAGILGCGCWIIFCHFGMRHYRTEAVEIYIRQAERAVKKEDIYSSYRKALDLQPENPMIYQSIQKHFIHSNDFKIEDAAEMMNLLERLNRGISPLEIFRNKNKSAYCDFCYEMGIGYFYYMGDITGKKEAQIWFQEVLNVSQECFSEEKQKRALLYRNICTYYDTFIQKGEDRSGEIGNEGYQEFYKTLHELNRVELSENSSQSEAAAVYLISKEIAIEIGNYAEEFLCEKNIHYNMLRQELDKILSGTKQRKGRMDILRLFKSEQDINELEELVQDAGNKLLFARKVYNKGEDFSGAE